MSLIHITVEINSNQAYTICMSYEFSILSFFIGLLILIASATVIVFHRPLADNLSSGVSSYDKFKMWGVISCVVGLLVMINLHWFLLSLLLSAFIPGLK